MCGFQQLPEIRLCFSKRDLAADPRLERDPLELCSGFSEIGNAFQVCAAVHAYAHPYVVRPVDLWQVRMTRVVQKLVELKLVTKRKVAHKRDYNVEATLSGVQLCADVEKGVVSSLEMILGRVPQRFHGKMLESVEKLRAKLIFPRFGGLIGPKGY